MVIAADGSVRTSSWTFHDQRQTAAEASSFTKPATGARESILAAIRATSDRHSGNRAVSAAGLSAKEWQVLFQAMIEAESAYDPGATSPKGAYGLGQLMPATARSLGVDRKDPDQNLEGAARYLLAQLSAFGDVDLALAAYNAGPDRVRQYEGVPPFAETQGYVARIHRIRSRLSGKPIDRSAMRLSRRNKARAPVVIDLH